MRRVLYLDGLPPGKKINYRYLGNREAINEIYSELFLLQHPPPITLDCRFLQPRMLTMILKFVEEYKADIFLLAFDPVPEPILSRFSEVIKTPMKRGKDFVEVKLKNVPPSMKERVNVLFGLSSEEDDYVPESQEF